MVGSGANILEPIAFPAIHNVDCGERLLVKIQFKHSSDTPGILQPLLCQFYKSVYGDFIAVVDFPGKDLSTTRPFLQILAQKPSGIQELFG